jgi:hypothetical protein
MVGETNAQKLSIGATKVYDDMSHNGSDKHCQRTECLCLMPLLLVCKHVHAQIEPEIRTMSFEFCIMTVYLENP